MPTHPDISSLIAEVRGLGGQVLLHLHCDVGETQTKRPGDDTPGFLCCEDLAKRFGVSSARLRRRLQLWLPRAQDGDWHENGDRANRGSKYYYRVTAVASIIERLQRHEASAAERN